MQLKWLEKRGLTFKSVPTPGDPKGLLTVNIRIKRWYIPFLALKGLRQSGIPRRYWPLFYWQYYIQRRWKHGESHA